MRSPASSGAVLVPVWGSPFVSQFLEFGLPSLLAPGNLPAVARELPFRVIARPARRMVRLSNPTRRGGTSRGFAPRISSRSTI
jgi:hypothetical protein